MKISKVIFIIFIILYCFTNFAHGESNSSNLSITYISSEGVYVNSGTSSSLKIGDTLKVVREEQEIALLLITNISTTSSACNILSQKESLMVGDIVIPVSMINSGIVKDGDNDLSQGKPQKKKNQNQANILSGYISFQNYLQKDYTSGDYSSNQPGLKTKFKIDKLFGRELTLKFSNRLRYYNRSRSYNANQDKWTSRFYELAIYNGDDSSTYQWGIGRQTVGYVRGIGFIDGFYLMKRLSDKIKAGFVTGGEPDYTSNNVDLNTKKAGIFVAYDNGYESNHRISLSGAISGVYYKSDISREFLYLQGNYYGPLISFYNSFEVDINRKWRKEIEGGILKLSNMYSTLSITPVDYLKLFLSYDNRRRIHTIDSKETPDSLFDDSNHEGVKAGFNLRPSKKITIFGNGGVRLRNGMLSDNKFGLLAITINQFPFKRQYTSFRFSYVSTMFTKGYRPSVSFRFPVHKQIRLSLTGTSNIYDYGTRTTTNTYLDLGSDYSFGNYFLQGSWRQYLSSDYKSTQMYLELGFRFSS